MRNVRVIETFVLILVVIVFLYSGLEYLISYLDLYSIINASYYEYFKGATLALMVYAVLVLIRKVAFSRILTSANSRTFENLNLVASTFIYFIMALVFLSSIGVRGDSVLISSSIVAAIVGLAAATILSGLVSGLYFNLAVPFKVGDLVTIRLLINGNLMGVIMPVIYPKFLSADRLEESYFHGIVRDISPYYTVMELEDASSVKIPNQILVNGAVISSGRGFTLKLRFEVPKYIRPEEIPGILGPAISDTCEEIVNVSILIDEVTLNSYLVTARIALSSAQNHSRIKLLLMNGLKESGIVSNRT